MNKTTKTLFLNILLLTIPIIYWGCDDSGVLVTQPTTAFSHTNLLRLDANENACYELFVSFGTGINSKIYCSMGKFNISTTGEAVDLSGNSMAFKFDFTPDMTKSQDAIITVEPLPDNDTLPNGTRILGGVKTIVNNVYVFNFNMFYEDVLGNIAAQFLTDSAKYILASPTAGYPSFDYKRGIWFTGDSSGISQSISSAIIPDSLKWIYHAYVIDSRDSVNSIYNVGKFADPNLTDDYNSCNGFGAPAWSKPGQDWIQAGCPGGTIHDIDGTSQYSLNNGSYRLLVTLEPSTRTLATPFYIKLFYGTIGASGFNMPAILQNVAGNYIPRGDLSIMVSSSSK